MWVQVGVEVAVEQGRGAGGLGDRLGEAAATLARVLQGPVPDGGQGRVAAGILEGRAPGQLTQAVHGCVALGQVLHGGLTSR